MTEIVKVQVPLASSGPHPLALVYPKARAPESLLRITPEITAALAGDPKGYFEAEFIDGQWVIGRRVGEQPW